jgi:hypothetical protein
MNGNERHLGSSAIRDNARGAFTVYRASTMRPSGGGESTRHEASRRVRM